MNSQKSALEKSWYLWSIAVKTWSVLSIDANIRVGLAKVIWIRSLSNIIEVTMIKMKLPPRSGPKHFPRPCKSRPRSW